jgi:hypothetical protein
MRASESHARYLEIARGYDMMRGLLSVYSLIGQWIEIRLTASWSVGARVVDALHSTRYE